MRDMATIRSAARWRVACSARELVSERARRAATAADRAIVQELESLEALKQERARRALQLQQLREAQAYADARTLILAMVRAIPSDDKEPWRTVAQLCTVSGMPDPRVRRAAASANGRGLLERMVLQYGDRDEVYELSALAKKLAATELELEARA